MFDNAHTADPVAASLPPVPVASVRCRVFRAPTSDGVAMSFAPLTHRVMVVVLVELADGRTGRGESWANYPSWAWCERVATVREGLAPLLVGRVLTTPVEVHDELVSVLGPLGRQWGAPGPVHQAVSAVDTALWDLAATAADLPLGGLIGGLIAEECAAVLPAYGSSLGPTGVEETAAACRDRGLRAAKVKVGFGLDRDHENLQAARGVLGPDVTLFADANQAWTLDEALAAVPVLREAGVAWLEEPLDGDDAASLARLRRESGIALATGENRYGAAAFADLLELDAVDILQPDLSKVGGPTDYLRVAAMAAGRDVAVNPHLYGGALATLATLQVAAAVPATTLVEWDVRENPLRAPVDHLLGPDGAITVPPGAGLGLDLDLAPLAHLEETP